jgi:hypothetical protein
MAAFRWPTKMYTRTVIEPVNVAEFKSDPSYSVPSIYAEPVSARAESVQAAHLRQLAARLEAEVVHYRTGWLAAGDVKFRDFDADLIAPLS